MTSAWLRWSAAEAGQSHPPYPARNNRNRDFERMISATFRSIVTCLSSEAIVISLSPLMCLSLRRAEDFHSDPCAVYTPRNGNVLDREVVSYSLKDTLLG